MQSAGCGVIVWVPGRFRVDLAFGPGKAPHGDRGLPVLRSAPLVHAVQPPGQVAHLVSSGFKVQDLGLRVEGLGFRV